MLDILAGYLDYIAALAPAWGYFFVFLFMAVESSFIPFPSEIVMIPAGFLAAMGELTCGSPYADLVLSVCAGLAGSLAGAFFNYWLSAKLGEPFLRKHGRKFFIKPEALDRAYEIFNKYGAGTTFVCRLIPVIRQLISIPAGLSGMDKRIFALFTGLGAGIWTAILAATGFWLGRTAGNITYLELVHRGRDIVSSHLWEIILAALALAGMYMFISRRVMKKKLA